MYQQRMAMQMLTSEESERRRGKARMRPYWNCKKQNYNQIIPTQLRWFGGITTLDRRSANCQFDSQLGLYRMVITHGRL